MSKHRAIHRVIPFLTSAAIVAAGMTWFASGAQAFVPTITPNPNSAIGTVCSGIGVGGLLPVDYTPTGFTAGYDLLYSATGLPQGLSVSGLTGDIMGSPTESGPFTATITAENLNAIGETASADIGFTIGAFAGPSLTFSSGSFPATTVGTPAALTVTVTNVDCRTTTISAVAVAPAVVSLVSTTCVAALGSGDTCEVRLSWNPATTGPLTNGLLTLTSDGVGASTQTLTGTASAAPEPTPVPEPEPAPVTPPFTPVPPPATTPTTTAPAATVTPSQQPPVGDSVVIISSGTKSASVSCGTASSTTATVTACASSNAVLQCRTSDGKTGPARGTVAPAPVHVPFNDFGMVLRTSPPNMLSLGQDYPQGQTAGYVPQQVNQSFPEKPTVSKKFTPNPPLSYDVPYNTCLMQPRAKPRTAPVGVTAVQGDVLFVQATGLAPQTAMSLYIGVPATHLADFRTDADGAASVWVRVPSSTPVGSSAVQVAGRMVDGYDVSMITGVALRAAQPHVVTSKVGVKADATALSKANKARISTLLGKVPATVPVTCTVRGLPVDVSGGRDASKASADLVRIYLKSRGLTCQVVKAAETGKAKVTVTTRFAN